MTSSRSTPSSRLADLALTRAAPVCAAVSGAVLLLLVGFVVLEATPLLHPAGLRRLVGLEWSPTLGRLGLLPMVVGSLVCAGAAVAVATPLGILSAVFQRFYAPAPVRLVYGRVLDVLAGVPSVVYALWGLLVVVPLLGRLRAPGTSVLAAALVLALMILPTVAVLAEAALASAGDEQVRAAAALGLTRSATIRAVVLPAVRGQLAAAALLAAGRALGETVVVLMVSGNVAAIPSGPLAPARALTANMALEMGYALGEHRTALFASGLALLLLFGAIVGAAALGRGRGTA